MINHLDRQFCSFLVATIGAWVLLKSLNSDSLLPRVETWATPIHLLGAVLGSAFLLQSCLLLKQFLGDK
jgi:hypothetical protein